MRGNLIPARFLTLIGHLCVVITLLWESQQSVKHCLPMEFHQMHLNSYQKQLIGGYGASIAFIFFELITFLSGFTMFASTTAFVSTGCHGVATIALAYFILDSWQCGWFWFIFVFCSVIPFLLDIITVITVFIKRAQNVAPSREKSFWSEWTSTLILAGVVTTLGSSLPVGYNIGVVNTPEEIIKQFCNESLITRYNSTISSGSLDILWSSIVSIFIIGGVTGSCLGATVADSIGRKGGIIIVNGLSFLASVLFVSSLPANSVEMLFLGRLIIGLSSGLATSIVPMYLTELSPLKLRGAMGVLCPLGVTAGVLFGQVMGLDGLLGADDDWHYLLSFFGILVIIFTPLLFFLPESPKYLFVVKSNPEMAIQALSRVTNKRPADLNAEITELQAEANDANDESQDGEQQKWGLLQVLRSRDLRLPLLLVCFMQGGQQTSGINAVFYYSRSIFRKAKLNAWQAQMASIGAGIVNFVMAVLAIPLMSRCGRRPLILLSTLTSMICLLALCLTINLIDYFEDWMPKLCIAAVLLYVMFYGLGLGPIPYFIASELFEVGPRPAAMALGSLCNWGGNFIVGMLFLSVQSYIGAYSFIIFAVSTAALLIFLRLYLPETKGKTPSEVSQMLSRGARVRSST